MRQQALRHCKRLIFISPASKGRDKKIIEKAEIDENDDDKRICKYGNSRFSRVPLRVFLKLF